MSVERKLIVREGDRVREVMLVGSITVGRSPLCEVSGSDPRLSREHAAIEVTGIDVFIRDLGSRNGTKVNGATITRQRLDAADTVEIGPFVIQLVEERTAQAELVAPPLGNDDRTVLLPPRAARAAAAPPAAPPAPSAPAANETGRPAGAPVPGTASADPAPPDRETDDEATRRITRSEARRRAAPSPVQDQPPQVSEPPAPSAAPADADPADEATRRITRSEVMRRTAPDPVLPAPPPPRPTPAPAAPTPAPRPPVTATPPPVAPSSPVAAPVAPPPVAASSPTAPTAVPRATAAELTFPRVALLWVVPVALVSFIAALVPSLLEPEQRAPLLRAHYAALATTAEELVRRSSEPAPPLDGVTTALRGYTGVTGARVLGADGRVLAPMNEAGTRLDVAPIEGRGPRITTAASGIVDVHTAAATADGRAVIVTLTVDPAAIHPPPAGSPTGAVMVLLSLAAAWLAARQLTQITDGRLSRLGEEVELMATRQVTAGHDPFGLRGGQRIVDAATFAVSPAARRPEGDDAPGERGGARTPAPSIDARAPAPTSAVLTVDATFRIVSADGGTASLIGVAPATAPGQHLIDALNDQAIADEVLRLAAAATAEQPIQSEIPAAGRGFGLAIEVTRGSGPVPLTIRFTRR